ncbi:ABC transporter permease [Geobacter sulfurreducens]|nr:ABC transporter permease [Geobacter sulfurreducens]
MGLEMNVFTATVMMTFRWIVRDRVLHAILAVALFMILLVPALSTFSMRQVQELSITLSLSTISFVLLMVTLLLGASSVWREIERRYVSSVLTLPASRAVFLLGRFCGIAGFIALCGVLLGLAAAVIIIISSTQYPSEVPIHWQKIALALLADILKYILLASVAIFFSALSTSFYFPFFSTIAIYLAGSGSQEVYEYATGQFGKEFNQLSVVILKIVYYVIPNFAAFDLKVQAIYGIPSLPSGLFLTFIYSFIYSAILLTGAAIIFTRRQFP